MCKDFRGLGNDTLDLDIDNIVYQEQRTAEDGSITQMQQGIPVPTKRMLKLFIAYICFFDAIHGRIYIPRYNKRKLRQVSHRRFCGCI